MYLKFRNEFGLSEYDAQTITDDKQTALYYIELSKYCKNYKAAANWVLGSVKSYLNETASEIDDFKLKPESLSALIALIDEGLLSNTAASQQVFPMMVMHPEKSALEIAETLNVIQSNDSSLIDAVVKEALSKYPDKIEEYKAGKKGLLGLFVGEVMKASKGKADPKVVNTETIKALEA